MKIGSKLPEGRLKKLREQRDLTQEQVKNKIGCDLKTYRAWEKEGNYPSADYLIGLAQLFGVSTDYLLGLSDYTNIGNKEMSETTGLSEYAIDILRAINSNRPGGEMYPQLLSIIISSSYFMGLIFQIRKYAMDIEKIKAELKKGGSENMALIESLSYTYRAGKFGVSDVLGDMLDEIVPVPPILSKRGVING